MEDIRRTAFAMPAHNPAYPRPPFRFLQRENFIVTYETDPIALRAVVPEPLMPDGNLVTFEFIRMPDSSGFGDYTESGQAIPIVDEAGRKGSYTHVMYLDVVGAKHLITDFTLDIGEIAFDYLAPAETAKLVVNQ